MSKQNNSLQLSPDDLNLNKPDRFQQFMFLMADRVYRQRQDTIAGGIAVVAIGIGFWYWQEQQRLQRRPKPIILRFSASSGKSCFAKTTNRGQSPHALP